VPSTSGDPNNPPSLDVITRSPPPSSPAMLPFPYTLPHGDSLMKKQTFIPVDLNKLPYVERYPIMNQSTIDTIKNEYGDIYDGLKIWLYSDTYKNRKLDPSVFQGIVRFNEELCEFEIEAKESDMVWLSESEQFKDYSIEDVIGKEMYDEYRKKRPDLL
jgi:hypothetical protein